MMNNADDDVGFLEIYIEKQPVRSFLSANEISLHGFFGCLGWTCENPSRRRTTAAW